MKKYILFTNTKEKYHAHSLEFDDFNLLLKHLKEEFNFEEWNFEDILKEYFNFLEYKDSELIFDYTIKDFLNDTFHILNCSSGLNAVLFEDLCNGKATILSTFTDTKYSVFAFKYLYDESDFLTMALNELLSKHGTTTSPVGVVNVYEIVAVGENIEGQEELELPF